MTGFILYDYKIHYWLFSFFSINGPCFIEIRKFMLSPVVQFVLLCTFGSAYLSFDIIVYQCKFSPWRIDSDASQNGAYLHRACRSYGILLSVRYSWDPQMT